MYLMGAHKRGEWGVGRASVWSLRAAGPSGWGDRGLNQTDAGTVTTQAGDKSHLTHKKGVGGDFPVLLLQRGGKNPKPQFK